MADPLSRPPTRAARTAPGTRPAGLPGLPRGPDPGRRVGRLRGPHRVLGSAHCYRDGGGRADHHIPRGSVAGTERAGAGDRFGPGGGDPGARLSGSGAVRRERRTRSHHGSRRDLLPEPAMAAREGDRCRRGPAAGWSSWKWTTQRMSGAGSWRSTPSWRFPEVWVEVPAPSWLPPRTSGRPGLVIHVLEGSQYVEAASSRAFFGWTAAEIHRALNEEGRSPATVAAVHRVGRRMGRAAGTGPGRRPVSWARSERRAGLMAGQKAGQKVGSKWSGPL